MATALFARERRVCALGDGGDFVGRQRRRAAKIDHEAEQHADAGCAKAVGPTGLLAERPADERCKEGADIDADIEDGKGAVAARVARRIKRSDLGRDVRLERPIAEDQRPECEEQQRLERHHEMAERH